MQQLYSEVLPPKFSAYLEARRLDKNTREKHLKQLEGIVNMINRGNPLGENKLHDFMAKFPDFKFSETFKPNEENNDTYGFVVLCALREPEGAEVINLLENRENAFLSNGIIYTKGLYEYRNNIKVKVAIFFQSQMGPVDAATMTGMILSEIKTEYFAMVGVCGGNADKGIKIGDIIVVEKALTYQSGEYVNGGFIPEPRFASSTDSVLRFIKEFGTGIKIKINREAPTDVLVNSNVKVGTMLCGDAIINEPGMVKSLSEKLDRRVVGVDMESYGVLRACEIYGNKKMNYIVIKGVMDVCEGRTEKRDKIAAANVAAKFLYYLVRDLVSQ